MKYLIPLAVIASLALASCDCLSSICSCCGDDTEQEAPADN